MKYVNPKYIKTALILDREQGNCVKGNCIKIRCDECLFSNSFGDQCCVTTGSLRLDSPCDNDRVKRIAKLYLMHCNPEDLLEALI